MAGIELSVRLTPQGRLIISGPAVGHLVKGFQAAELWFSQPDQGLAVHFLTQAGRASLPLQHHPDRTDEIYLEAGSVLDKAAYPRPDKEMTMQVVAFDSARAVLSARPGPAAEIKFEPGWVLKNL